jgi:hypothetical protein
MNFKNLCCMLLIPLLFACGSIPTTGPTPVSSLPDLAILGVHVSDVDENNNCLHEYVILATLVNRGNAPAYNVTLAETATGVSIPVQVLGANEKLVVHFPVATGGMYTVVADPDNSILESDETNNSLSYIAPTPTPSIPCVPTSPADATPAPTIVLIESGGIQPFPTYDIPDTWGEPMSILSSVHHSFSALCNYKENKQ